MQSELNTASFSYVLLPPREKTKYDSVNYNASNCSHLSDLRAPEVQGVLAAGLPAPASALRAVTPVLASLTQSKPRLSGRGWAGRAV